MSAELILALAHLQRMIQTHVPANASRHLALKELETLEFQIALAISMRDAA